jgi:uncharacterized membrane protein SirB2
MSYQVLKWAHLGLATLSILGFVLRWNWAMRGSALIQHQLTRILPHVLDSLFLASGIALAWTARINPLAHPWLLAKLVGVVVYIGLASLAYKYSATRRQATVCFVAALLVFAWIATVARLKTPLGFLILFGS